MIEINKVYNEDCLIGMQNIDNDSIDCIICDLPYFKVVDDSTIQEVMLLHLDMNLLHFYAKKGSESTFNNIKIKPDTNRKEYTEGFLKDGITLSDVWTDIPALPHNSKERHHIQLKNL